MKQEKITKDEISLIILGSQSIYFLMAVGYYIYTLFTEEVISTTPFFLQSGFVWGLAIAFYCVDHLLLRGMEQNKFGIIHAAVRGCAFALMLLHGNTMGLVVSFIILFLGYGFYPAGSWEKARTEVGIFSCMVLLAATGLCLMLTGKGDGWLQTDVIATWIMDVILLVSVILLCVKKL